MDPIVLTTTAAVVGQTGRSTFNVSDELKVYLLSAKPSQDEVRSLQREVKSFGDGCDALQSLLYGLASSKTQVAEVQDAQFYIKIQQAMSEYAATVGALGQHVRTMDSSKSRRPSWMSTFSSAKSDEFVRARQRIDSHLLSLQLMLAILNLYVDPRSKIVRSTVAYITDSRSRLSLQSLEIVDMSVLRSGIQELQRKRARLQAMASVNSPYLGQDQKLFDTTAGLIAEADLALTLAVPAYEDTMSARSTTSASRTGTVTDQALKDTPVSRTSPSVTTQSINEVDTRPTYYETVMRSPPASSSMVPRPLVVQTAFSPLTVDISEELGSQLNSSSMVPPATGANVSNWIQGLSDLDKRQRSSTIASRQVTSNRSASTADSEVMSAQSLGERLNSDATSLTQLSSQPPRSITDFSKSDGARQLTTAAAVMDDSDDDDIEVELARNVLSIGKTALDEEDYQKARRCLLEGLGLVQKLPSRSHASACDMLELRYQLATCALALDHQLAIERALVEVLQQEPSSDAQREKLFHISHILAQLYIRTARLTLAKQTCTNALRGRRKLFGKEYDGYYSSLGLIARISELENAPLQAQGYINMIPEAERSKYTFEHIKIEEHCEKEVFIAELESPPQSTGPATPVPAITTRAPTADRSSFFRPISTVEIHRQPSFRTGSMVESAISEPVSALRSPVQPSSAPFSPYPPVVAPIIVQHPPQPVARFEDTVPPPYRPSSIQRSGSALVSPLISPSSDNRRSFIDVPIPSPRNEYLGYCKGAWMLQTGDAKAMKKSKDFNLGSRSVYNLVCTASKCAFGTDIEYSVIGTWAELHKTKERLGIAYRWAFLAKSHVQQQIKVPAHQTLYKCMFCIALGATAPVMQGTDLYLEHIAQEHRGKVLGGVVLTQTRCIDDRICTDKDEFDINLYPRTT